MEYLLKGILIGLLFGLPVGAVGALTVQRSKQQRTLDLPKCFSHPLRRIPWHLPLVGKFDCCHRYHQEKNNLV